VREVTETAPLAFRFRCVGRSEDVQGGALSTPGTGRLKNVTFRMTLTGPAISEIDVDVSSNVVGFVRKKTVSERTEFYEIDFLPENQYLPDEWTFVVSYLPADHQPGERRFVVRHTHATRPLDCLTVSEEDEQSVSQHDPPDGGSTPNRQRSP